MQVTVFGSGYVGLVAAACLAEVGNQVICVDVDEAKINALNEGQLPIYEPGLKEIVKQAIDKKNLSFTTQVQGSVRHGDVVYIAVGTPQDEDGSADLQYVLQVAKTIGQYLEDYTIIINKSTVLVGTADKVRAVVQQELDKRLRRFFKEFKGFSFEVLSKFIAATFLPGNSKWELTMDRTNWKWGKTNINILMISAVRGTVAIPLIWKLLPKKGSSNTDEWIQIVEHFIKIFGVDVISELLGDREFVSA